MGLQFSIDNYLLRVSGWALTEYGDSLQSCLLEIWKKFGSVTGLPCCLFQLLPPPTPDMGTSHQGWAQDLLGRDRDQDRDLGPRDRDETEPFAKLSETRPRRDPRVSETRPRRDLFLVETISRHMAYICMVYALHTVSQKRIP